MKKVFAIIIVFLGTASVTQAATQPSLIINEIAWMGNETSANDEWIELFNTTDSPINMNGWTLISKDQKLTIRLKGSIGGRGFYLLERTDNNSVPAVAANLIYKGALANTGEDLVLRNASNAIIDEVQSAAGWPQGSVKTKQTMEKNDSGWQTSENPNGTPKAQNSSGVKPSNLPNTEKSGNTVNIASASGANENLGKLFNQKLNQDSNSPLNPWILFLTAVVLSITSAVIILFIKLKATKHVRSQPF